MPTLITAFIKMISQWICRPRSALFLFPRRATASHPTTLMGLLYWYYIHTIFFFIIICCIYTIHWIRIGSYGKKKLKLITLTGEVFAIIIAITTSTNRVVVIIFIVVSLFRLLLLLLLPFCMRLLLFLLWLR